jgi:hypothetical protein
VRTERMCVVGIGLEVLMNSFRQLWSVLPPLPPSRPRIPENTTTKAIWGGGVREGGDLSRTLALYSSQACFKEPCLGRARTGLQSHLSGSDFPE